MRNHWNHFVVETHHKSVHVVAALFRRDWLFGRIASLYTLAGVAGPSQGRRGGELLCEELVSQASQPAIKPPAGRESCLGITALSFHHCWQAGSSDCCNCGLSEALLQYHHLSAASLPDDDVLGLCFALCLRSGEMEAWSVAPLMTFH